jgi:hypothetical protein
MEMILTKRNKRKNLVLKMMVFEMYYKDDDGYWRITVKIKVGHMKKCALKIALIKINKMMINNRCLFP